MLFYAPIIVESRSSSNINLREQCPISPKVQYNYTTVLKYRVQDVHRGQLDADVVYVGHYNPFKPRDEAADRRAPEIGGDLETFEPGQIHRMALEVPIDDFYMGGIVNKYFDEKPDPIYWGVWTNLVPK